MTRAARRAQGTCEGGRMAPARPSRGATVIGRAGNRLTQPKVVSIAALFPASQAVPRNMTGSEGPAGHRGTPITRTGRTPKDVQPPACRHRGAWVGAARFRKEAKRRTRDDSLTPSPRINSASAPMERNGSARLRPAGQHFVPTTGEVRSRLTLTIQQIRLVKTEHSKAQESQCKNVAQCARAFRR